jgi:hypothetical protein
MDASGRKIYDDEASFLTWALSSQATELAFPVYGLVGREDISCSRAEKTHRKHFRATGQALFSGSFFRLRDGQYRRDSFSEMVVNICLTNRFQFHSHFGVFVAKTGDFAPDGICCLSLLPQLWICDHDGMIFFSHAPLDWRFFSLMSFLCSQMCSNWLDVLCQTMCF